MSLQEITLPLTKPETEWVRGRALQKVSPTYRHARLQALITTALTAWAEGQGRVGSEWRFRVNPPGAVVRPLVPDVAYLSYARLPLDADEEAQVPLGAPDIAVEILSPGDRTADVADKVTTYLRAGTGLVLIVDPAGETVVAIDDDARTAFVRGDEFCHRAARGFVIDVAALFDRARH
jgi:Uma2 family endonuclease